VWEGNISGGSKTEYRLFVRYKLNLPPVLEHHAFKRGGGAGKTSFLISVLRGGVWSALSSDCFKAK